MGRACDAIARSYAMYASHLKIVLFCVLFVMHIAIQMLQLSYIYCFHVFYACLSL